MRGLRTLLLASLAAAGVLVPGLVHWPQRFQTVAVELRLDGLSRVRIVELSDGRPDMTIADHDIARPLSYDFTGARPFARFRLQVDRLDGRAPESLAFEPEGRGLRRCTIRVVIGADRSEIGDCRSD
jgi:hypothetical protein